MNMVVSFKQANFLSFHCVAISKIMLSKMTVALALTIVVVMYFLMGGLAGMAGG